MDAGTPFLLGKAAFVEKLLHQSIVRLSDQFDELFVQCFHTLGPFARGFGFCELAASVGGVSDNLIARHIQHLVEAGAGIDRYGHRKNSLAEVLAYLRERLFEIRLLFIKGIHDDHLGNAVLRRVFPDRISADPYAMIRMDGDERKVAHPQCSQALADKVRITWTIENIEFLSEPFEVDQRGGN